MWKSHTPKSIMHHQYKRFKPPPLLHLLCWDKCLHNKTVPTILPPTINKGKLEITELGIKAITNQKEAVNNQILPTILG